jgi:hypothetical protein
VYAEILARIAQIRRNGRGADDHVEENVPLRAEDHQRAEPDVRRELQQHHHGHDDRKEQIRRKGGEELRDRLHDAGHARPQSDPYADRYPYQGRQRDQHRDAHQGDEAEADDVCDLAGRYLTQHEVDGLDERRDAD